MRLPKSPPPADHRHVQQADLPAEQIYTLGPVPRSRVAGCVLAVLVAAVTAAAASALLPEFGLLLAVPGLLAGVPALVALVGDHRRHRAAGSRN